MWGLPQGLFGLPRHSDDSNHCRPPVTVGIPTSLPSFSTISGSWTRRVSLDLTTPSPTDRPRSWHPLRVSLHPPSHCLPPGESEKGKGEGRQKVDMEGFDKPSVNCSLRPYTSSGLYRVSSLPGLLPRLPFIEPGRTTFGTL